jgi:alginate O-acetyltransferase complex protein AlgI
MLLGGLWHGASWTFVAWGALHGAGLIICRLWKLFRPADRQRSRSGYFAGIVLTFLFTTLAWIFFRSPDFATAALVLQRLTIFTPPTLMPWPIAVLVMALLVAFSVVDLESVAAKVNRYGFAFAYGAAVAFILPFVNVNVQPFIYFQF